MDARRTSIDEPVVVREELPPPVTDDRLRPPATYDSLPYEQVERTTTTHTRAAFSLAQFFHGFSFGFHLERTRAFAYPCAASSNRG